MGIKGLQTRMAILGHIKIGGKKKINRPADKGGPYLRPVKFDHFVVTTTDQDELGYIKDDVLMGKLMSDQLNMLVAEHTEKIYNEGGELVKTVQTISTDELRKQHSVLRRILVSLPFDDPDQNLVTSLAIYDREGCRCRGDAESADWVDPRTGEVSKVKCPCNLFMAKLHPGDEPDQRPAHEKGLKPNPKKGVTCKANGNLRVMIARAKTLGGIHQFRTTSMNSITQLMAAMNQVREITGGLLAGVPMALEVYPKKVSPGPNQKPQTVYVVTLTHRASINDFLRDVAEQTALRESMRKQIAAKEILELPAPGMESRFEQVAIGQEYYGTEAAAFVSATGEELAALPEVVADVSGEEREKADEPKKKSEPKKKTETTKQQGNKSAEKAPEKTEEPEPTEEAGQSEAPQEEAQSPGEDQGKNSSGDGSDSKDDGPAEIPQDDPGDQVENPEDEERTPQFPDVDIEPPEAADMSNASKDLRKSFFKKARSAGFTDTAIRDWMSELWNIQSSAKLLTWQTEAMIAAIDGLKK